jgi:PASTA domain/F5/8 type C domain
MKDRLTLRWAAVAAAVLCAWAAPGAAHAAAPPNDAFAQAQTLPGESGSVTGSNADATSEANEPSHAGEGPLHSVWFRWTSSAAGAAHFDTCGSSFDTVLAVYTGDGLASLEPVVSNDDACDLGSSVSFAVEAGKTYSIAVDGYDGDMGTVELSWMRPPANTTRPAVSGVPRDGEVLVASPGTWSGSEHATFEYRWQRCSTAVGSQNIARGAAATASSDIPSFPASLAVDGNRHTAFNSGEFPPQWIAFDLGEPHPARGIRLVFAQHPAGQTTNSILVRGPGLTDRYRELEQLSTYTFDGAEIERAFQAAGEVQFVAVETVSSPSWVGWREIEVLGECVDIPAAGNAVYGLRGEDVGASVRVVVTATSAAGSVTAASERTPVVAGILPVNLLPPAIGGNLRVGELLTAHPGTWHGTQPLEFTFHWQRCNRSGAECLDLDVGEIDAYFLEATDAGRRIRVDVTATNAAGSGAALSAMTGVIRGAPRPPCVVPNVRRRTLVAARRAITRAGCSVGRVRRVRSTRARGRVVSQSPRPGARRPRGTRVNLVVSRGRR